LQIEEEEDHVERGKVAKAFHYLSRDLKSAYTNVAVVKWSVWWALATCGCYQVVNYAQLIWEEIIAVSGQSLYNGALEAVYTIVGAVCALTFGSLSLDWTLLGPPALATCALLQAAAVFAIAATHNLWVAYPCYVVCLAAYQALATIARCLLIPFVTLIISLF